MFVKHACNKVHRRHKSQCLTFDPAPLNPQGQPILVKCKKPLGELTVQVWLLYSHQMLRYFTLCKWDEIA